MFAATFAGTRNGTMSQKFRNIYRTSIFTGDLTLRKLSSKLDFANVRYLHTYSEYLRSTYGKILTSSCLTKSSFSIRLFQFPRFDILLHDLMTSLIAISARSPKPRTKISANRSFEKSPFLRLKTIYFNFDGDKQIDFKQPYRARE